MPRQDFYITFGSDITEFNAGLIRELERTTKIIGDFESRLNKVGSGAASSPLARMLDQMASAERMLHDQGGQGGNVPRSTSGNDANQIRQAMQTLASELQKVVRQVRGEAARTAPAGAGTRTPVMAVPTVAGAVRPRSQEPTVAATQGKGAGAEGRDESLLTRILAELVSIHGSIRSRTSAATRNTPGTGSRPAATPAAGGSNAAREAAAAANSEEHLAQVRARTDGVTYSSIAAQREYIAQLARIRPELAALINAEDKLAAAARLVVSGELKQTEALDLLGHAFGRTRREAEQNLRTAVGSTRLGDRSAQLAAAADQRQREEANPPVVVPTIDSRAVAPAVNSARQAGAQVGDAMGMSARERFSAVFGATGFYGRVVHSVGTFLVRNFSAGLVFGLTNALQDAISQAIQTESTFVRVSEALKDTGRSTAGLRTQLQGLSMEYGVALKDVYETTAGLAGLFDQSDTGNKQLIALTRVALQLESISGGALNSTEAMKSLVSVTSAYANEAPEHIADVATVIQNRLSVNIEETLEGVARLSAQTAQLGIHFENAAVYVAAISKYTAQTGAGAGEQFSRMIASLQTGRTQSIVARAFATKGVDVQALFNQRDYQSAFNAILANYSKLTKAQRDQVATAIGGQRQAASTNALLIQGAKVLDVVTAAEHSRGAAQTRAAAINDQLNRQMARLKQSFVDFISVLERTGALDAVAVVFQSLLYVMEHVNTALSKFNDLIDEIPGMRTMAHLLAIVGGLALGFRLARSAAAGFAAVLSTGAAVRGLAARAGGTAAAGEGAAAGGSLSRAAGTAGNIGLLALLFRRGPRPTVPLVPASAAAADAARSSAYFVPSAAASAATFYNSYEQPQGRLSRFYERRAQNFTNLSNRVADRLAPVQSELRASAAARTGASAATLGRAERALAATSTLASRSLNGVATGMMFMSRNAITATAALAAVAVGVVAIIGGMQSFAQAHDDYKKAWQDTFGGVDPKKKRDTGSPESNATAEAFASASKKNQDANQAIVSGIERAILQTITGAFQGNFPSIKNPFSRVLNGDTSFGAILGPLNPGNWVGPNQKEVDRATGVLSEKENAHFTDTVRSTFGRLIKFWHGQAVTTKNVKKAIDANEKEIQKEADRINNSDMSDAQKEAALESLADLQGRLRASGEKWALVAAGMKKTDALTTDQLQGIGQMVQSIASFGNSALRMYSSLVGQYIASLGFDTNNTVASDLKELASGKATDRYYGGGWHPMSAEQARSGYAPGGSVYQSQVPRAAWEPTRERGMNPIEKAAVSEKALKHALDVAQVQINALPEGEDKTAQIEAAMGLLSQYNQSVQNRLQTAAQNAQSVVEHDRAQGNYTAAASHGIAQLQALQQQLKEGYLTQEQLQSQADQINDQMAQDRATAASARWEEAKLHTRNQIDLARDELNAATAAYNALIADTKHPASEATRRAARQRINAAQNAYEDAQNSLAVSQLQLSQLQNSPRNNSLTNARNALNVARLQLAQAAATYKVGSTQWNDAMRGVIEAQRNVDQAVRDRADAIYSVLQAQAEYSGNTIRQARLTLRKANRDYNRALADAGGDRNDPAVKNADAARIQARAGLRDAQFQDALDTINFNHEMGKLSSAATIAQLQNLLKMKDLTRAQRRQILEQIHGLQQGLVDQLTSSGFNLPGEVKLPTVYQVRRSLGIDHARTLVKQSVDDLTNAAKPNALAGGSSAPVVNALREVRDAVNAKGAQQIRVDQKNTYHVPTAAVARQIADQIISMINQQNGQHVRANTSTPRLVQTR